MKIEPYAMAKYHHGAFLVPGHFVPRTVGGMIRNHIKNPAEFSSRATQPDATANLSDVGPFEIS
jgi:hypothetical protein